MRRLLIFLLLAAALATGCTPRPGGRIVYGLTLAPTGIDPHINASAELGIPLTSVYDTLVYQDPKTGEFVPGLAQKWEVSEDGRIYTFYLRRGVKFHDGTPFNAEAVRFNLDRITSPDLASQKARFMLGPYERTEVVDEYTVRIVLKEPFAPLLDSLSQVYLGMASPTAVQQWGQEYQVHQVGTGPFIFAEYVPSGHLLLRRNPDYAWGPSVYQHKTAQLEEVEFRFFTDPATRSPALESGEADVMGEVPPQDAVRLKDDPRFRIEAVAIPGSSLMFFMNTTRPPLDDLAVRQAILYGTDRQAIISAVFKDTSPVACGPLAAVTFGYDPSVCQYYPYDPARARALLEERGWKDSDGDGIREKDGQPLVLDLYLMSWGYLPTIGELLIAQWTDLGIRVNAQTVRYPEALQIGREGRHHLMPFQSSGSDPDVLRQFFHSQGSMNWSKVNDPEMDGWLMEGMRTSDRQQRAADYSQVQRRVMEQALVLPIRDYVNLNGVNQRVQGLRFDARGWFPWLIDVTLGQ